LKITQLRERAQGEKVFKDLGETRTRVKTPWMTRIKKMEMTAQKTGSKQKQYDPP